MLHRIFDSGWRHGDLTSVNVVANVHGVRAVDWQEAHPFSEPPPPKRTTTDSWEMMNTVAHSWGRDTSRIARRWLRILEHFDLKEYSHQVPVPAGAWKLIEYGAHDGLFTLLARAAGFDAIAIGRSYAALTSHPGAVPYLHADLADMTIGTDSDVALYMSTHAWIEKEHGADVALDVLSKILQASKHVIFETQLAGDGPGTLPNNDAVYDLLLRAGSTPPVALANIPVAGRHTSRTLYCASRFEHDHR